MVVCKCHKATKTYCFVHKVPVCADCICQHPICVVRTYAEWVIDGDYEWPPKCSACQQVMREDEPTCRLGCLHNFHASCLEAHLKTPAAAYVCLSCGSPVWPPQNFRDHNAELPTRLKYIIGQAGLSSSLLGAQNDTERSPTPPPASPPAALIPLPAGDSNGQVEVAITSSEITSADDPSTSSKKSQQASSLARKSSYRPPAYGESEDEEAVRKKYARRGPLYKQLLRWVLPFWSPQLPILPITTPRKDERGHEDDHSAEATAAAPHRRRQLHHHHHHRSSAVDPRNVLFVLAILSCVATMMILYYRLIQRYPAPAANMGKISSLE